MRYAVNLTKESMVSGLINSIISSGFFFAFFSGVSSIPVWGIGGYAMDFVPQSFAVSLMSALVPGLLVRKKLGEGRGEGSHVPSVIGIFLRALGWAFAGLAIGGGLAALLLKAGGGEVITSTPALTVKILYGALLGAAVTYLSLSRLVRGAA